MVETEPGMKGDTVSNVTKAAKVETGGTVQFPVYQQGEIIRVDTRDGSYVNR